MKRANTRISILLKQQLDQKLWYERLNLVNKFKRICQWCTGNFSFWVAVGGFSMVEPILCSYRPVGLILYAQVAVLAASSILYVIQLVGCASREWDKIVMIQAMSSSRTIITVQDFTPFKVFIFFSAEGEYILEFCCLLGGWLTIFIRPGLAVLRSFRVFRLLWFYEVIVFKTTIEDAFDPIFGAEFVARCFKVLKFSIKALTALGNEMFRLTNATRGGLLLMLVFFYSAFVLGTTLWIETAGTSEFCMTKSGCVYTLMRLTFYDGTGFDFTYSLVQNHTFLFFICIAYMCVTSFGILNGLVGIFGTLFQTASDDAFNDSEGDGNSSEADSLRDDPDIDDLDDPNNNNNKEFGQECSGVGVGGGSPRYQKRTHRLASLVFLSHQQQDQQHHPESQYVQQYGYDHSDNDNAGNYSSGGNAVPFARQQATHSPRANTHPAHHNNTNNTNSPNHTNHTNNTHGDTCGIAMEDEHAQYVLSDEEHSSAVVLGEGSVCDDEVWAYGSDDGGSVARRTHSVSAGGVGAVTGANNTNTIGVVGSSVHVPPLSRDTSRRDSGGNSGVRDPPLQSTQQTHTPYTPQPHTQSHTQLHTQALAKSQYGSFSLADKAAVQRRLAGKIGGASHFALMELKKMAAQETHTSTGAGTSGGISGGGIGTIGGVDRHRNVHTTHSTLSANASSHSIKAGQSNSQSYGIGPVYDQGKVYPASGIADLSEHSEPPPEHRYQHKPQTHTIHQHHLSHQPPTNTHYTNHTQHHSTSGGHARHTPAHGMFGQLRRQHSHRSNGAHSHTHSTDHRPNPFAPKANHNTHAGQAHAAQMQHSAKDNSAEIKALAVQVQSLSRTVEVQNDMIIALFSQIQQSLRHNQHSGPRNSNDSGGGTEGGNSSGGYTAAVNTAHTATPALAETEILFLEMAPSKNMAAHVARYLPSNTYPPQSTSYTTPTTLLNAPPATQHGTPLQTTLLTTLSSLPAVSVLHPNAHATPHTPHTQHVQEQTPYTQHTYPPHSLAGSVLPVLASIPPRTNTTTDNGTTTPAVNTTTNNGTTTATPTTTTTSTTTNTTATTTPTTTKQAAVLHIDTQVQKNSLQTHSSDLNTALTSPHTPHTLGTRSSTSTTSAEMSAFSLLVPELKINNK